MRMGQALEDCGIRIRGVARCSDYSPKFSDHAPGHIRGAQDLANIFYTTPSLLGARVRTQIFEGSVDTNVDSFTRRQGMVFIMNGWGTTDRIDLWDGRTLDMRGTFDPVGFRGAGRHVWFWEL